MKDRTVYVPNLPTRWDPLMERYVPTINTQPATEFGEVRVLSETADVSAHQASLTASRIRQQMMDVAEDDFIVIAGDASLCGIAIHCALSLCGVANVLRWDRGNREYEIIKYTQNQE